MDQSEEITRSDKAAVLINPKNSIERAMEMAERKHAANPLVQLDIWRRFGAPKESYAV